MKTRTKKALTYAVSLLIPLAVGGISSLLISGDTAVYAELARPPLSPPAWVFSVVWTALYVLMGVGSARVCLSPFPVKNDALFIYAVQLFVVFLWPVFFFRFRAYLIAFFWIVFLLMLIVLMIGRFKAADEKAARLQIPYLVWCVYAAYLSLAVCILN